MLLAKSKKRDKAPRLQCGKCAVFFRSEDLDARGERVCSGCQSEQSLFVFPAFAHRTIHSASRDVLPSNGEGSCYHAADRKAVASCGDCGRPVSEFVKVAIGQDVSCLSCLEAKCEDGDDVRVEVRRIAADNRALLLAALPLISVIAIGLTFLTAPIALFFAVRDWSKGTISILSKSRWKLKLAAGLAVLQIGFWAWGFTAAWDDFSEALIGENEDWEMDEEGWDDAEWDFSEMEGVESF